MGLVWIVLPHGRGRERKREGEPKGGEEKGKAELPKKGRRH